MKENGRSWTKNAGQRLAGADTGPRPPFVLAAPVGTRLFIKVAGVIFPLWPFGSPIPQGPLCAWGRSARGPLPILAPNWT